MSTNISFSAAVLFSFFIASNAQTAGPQKNTSSQSGSQNAAEAFNGAGRTSDNKGFSVMHDGYFNSVVEDSTG